MTTRNVTYVVHPALGALDASKAPTILEPDQLALAENIEYYLSGARRKRLGTTRYNSAQIAEAGTAITFTNLSDFWRHGASLSPVQKFVATGGTQIWKDDGDGVWDSLLTSWGTNGTFASIVIAQGYAVFSTTNGDAPQKWDQTTLSALAGTPPTFSFGSYHQRRLWVAGIAATPSQMTYSAAGGIETWSGSDSGNLILNEDDGDRIMGVSKTFRQRLYAFKGPNEGSIWEIGGSSASGTDAYTRNQIFNGLPCVSHNAIVSTPNDVFWMSPYGVHSLVATEKYGNIETAFVSRPIQALFNDLNIGRLNQAFAFYHPRRNICGWFVVSSGQTQNTRCLVYNYALNSWSVWIFSGLNGGCARVMKTPGTGLPRLYIGGYSGYVHAGDQGTLSDDNAATAYTARIQSPIYIRLGSKESNPPSPMTELTEKQFYSVTTMFKPTGAYNANLTVTIDGRTQSPTVSLAGSGAALDSFVLDTDVLGGNDYTYVESIINDRGRAIQLEYSQSGANQDMELYGWGIRAWPAEGISMESS